MQIVCVRLCHLREVAVKQVSEQVDGLLGSCFETVTEGLAGVLFHPLIQALFAHHIEVNHVQVLLSLEVQLLSENRAHDVFREVSFAHSWDSNWEHNHNLSLLFNSSRLRRGNFHLRDWSGSGSLGLFLFLGSCLLCLFDWLGLAWLFDLLLFVVRINYRDIHGRRFLKLQDHHELLFVVEVHARGVYQLNQFGRVSHFDHFICLFAHKSSTCGVLKTEVGVILGLV